MPTLVTFLMGMVGPMVIKALIAVGVGTVTFTGVTATLESLFAMSQSSWGGMLPAVLGLASVAGIPECLGIVTGAMSSRVSIWVAVSATRFVLKP